MFEQLWLGDYFILLCCLLSGKVFSKLSYTVPKSTVKDVAECKPGVIEIVLANLRMKVSYFLLFSFGIIRQCISPLPNFRLY